MIISKFDLSEVVVISYFTEGYYEKVFRENLFPSLEAQGLSYYVESLPSKNTWAKNTNIKPFFVRRMLDMFPDKTLVWVDVDARIIRYPMLFETISSKFDMGVFYLDLDSWYGTTKYNSKKELVSCVVLVRNRPATIKVVDEWIERVRKEPQLWEQKHLQAAVEASEIPVFYFPLEYSYIHSLPNGSAPKVTVRNPVIVQYQASREVRKRRVKV